MEQISPGRVGRLKMSVSPSGDVDGVNTSFTVSPDKFLHLPGYSERVYLRGLRLLEGVGNDYVASESGGPGTGYDTITLRAAPLSGDTILLDYYLGA